METITVGGSMPYRYMDLLKMDKLNDTFHVELRDRVTNELIILSIYDQYDTPHDIMRVLVGELLEIWYANSTWVQEYMSGGQRTMTFKLGDHEYKYPFTILRVGV